MSRLKTKPQGGFIQIPILIAILIGATILGGGGYLVLKGISRPTLIAVSNKNIVATASAAAAASAEPPVSPATTTIQTKIVPAIPNKQHTNTKTEASSASGLNASKTEAKAVEVIQTTAQEIPKPIIATLSLSCAPDVDFAKPLIPVIWTASSTGGVAPYKYSWSEPFNAIVNSSVPESQTYEVKYRARTETRKETESVTVSSADGQSVSANCSVMVRGTPDGATVSDLACLAQKQIYLSEVDAAYLSWFDQWQAARVQLDPCYSSNPIPYCDKKMSDLNVEWQEKISVTMKSYQDKLTQCAPDQRRFGDVSDVVSSSY